MERLRDLILLILFCYCLYSMVIDFSVSAYEQGYADAIAEENIYACELIT